MRKELVAVLVFVFMSATAYAGGWGNKNVQTRWGDQADLGVPPEFAPCRHSIAWAQVHDFGVRFTIMAWGCNPGHVFSVWGIIGPDPDLGLTLNCGGGIVFPNGRFKTMCDVPIGNLTDNVVLELVEKYEMCKGGVLRIPIAPGVFIPIPVSSGCAQTVFGGGRIMEEGAFLTEDLHIDILTHDELDPEISMAQIRTLTPCSFSLLDNGADGMFGTDDDIVGPDSCIPIRFSFPAP